MADIPGLEVQNTILVSGIFHDTKREIYIFLLGYI